MKVLRTGKCGHVYLDEKRSTWRICQDCREPFETRDPPDVVSLMESKNHANRRRRDAESALARNESGE